MNVAELRGLFFLDTNVLVYSLDGRDRRKQTTARQIVAHALSTRRGVISSQIVQEFLNLALHKFERRMSVSEGRMYLNTVLMPLCQHFPSTAFYDKALLLKEETGYHFYDTMVVAAALELECRTLLTEDLQSGRVLQRLTILNPFAT